MHRSFEPSLVNGEFGDPALYVDFRDERRALLFDLGELSRLPPRKLLRVSHVFVTHTHMDHFAGFDHLLRVILGRKPLLALYGGPDFIDQVGHKLAAYAWNVIDRYEPPLTLLVHALEGPGRWRRARFSSGRRFAREDLPDVPATGDVVHEEPTFRVRACVVDHGIACLAYALEETARVKVGKDRLRALGLGAGAWLADLKRAVVSGAPDDAPIAVAWRDADGEHRCVRRVGELRQALLATVAGERIGYVTDLRYTEANLRALGALLQGVDRLFIESVFLHEDLAHAERKNHLTAWQAGTIARAVGARAVVPFHFSPRYEDRADALRAQLVAAWRGEAAAEPSHEPRRERRRAAGEAAQP
ncbi:MAG: MBL fold metallo-hydrolase [Burkholderiaceae bacterium]|nr:MBL fold metallo-hydrolase [Burkholderiaceae bacterium]